MRSRAGPLPVFVIGDMLGVDAALRAQFKQWSEAIAASLFNPFRSAQQATFAASAAQELFKYFTQLVEQRSKAPADDLISSMLTSDADSQALSMEELLAQCLLLLLAGNVTTTDLIGNAVRALLTHPDQMAALRADTELIGAAIEEVLRYDSPVVQAVRVVPQDMTFGGCPFRKGQSVQLSLAGANRDPRANPEPDRFDIRRRDIRHHSFGGNKHLCLGATLARVEAQEALLALLRRYPKLELVEQEYEFRPWPGLRGTQEVWLRQG
jgi:cytochrome P450